MIWSKTSKFQLKSKYGTHTKLCCVLLSILSITILLQVFSKSTYGTKAPNNGRLEDSSGNEVGNLNNSDPARAYNLYDQDRSHEAVDHKYLYTNAILHEEPINLIKSAAIDRKFVDTPQQASPVIQNSDSNHRPILRERRNIGADLGEVKSDDWTSDKHKPVGISEQTKIQEQDGTVAPDEDYLQTANNTQNLHIPDGNIDIEIAYKDGNNEEDKKTLVSVTSKSGKFNPAVLPLDDLIVSPATDSQVDSNLIAQHPLISGDTEISDEQHEISENDVGHSIAQQPTPNLAELTALGTATGLLLGDLAAQQATSSNSYNPYENEENSRSAHGLALQNALSRNDVPQSYNPYLPVIRQNVAFDPEASNYIRQPKQDLEDSPENSPDSMESLMMTEDEDMGAQNDQGDPAKRSSSNLVQGGNVGNLNVPPGNINDRDENVDEDNSPDEEQPNQTLIPHSMPFMGNPPPVAGQLFEQSLHPKPFMDGQHIVPMRDSMTDLNTAAGHYYGKKKKKKVIVKKKKKKKKKIKTVKKKKVRVVKYKVKKIKVKKVKKKKKKKKKKKEKEKKHHDHGKYYMYAKVPKKKAWEFGFKKGNKKHWIERHEKGHKNKFKTKVKWYDKKSKGKGMHIWDYNHHDKKKKKHYG